MKEFAYSVDGLADELAPRLEQARLSPKAERRMHKPMLLVK
ncbi:MAG: hypothetical protein R3C56_35540 [Pirellulaceae bacterium]